MPVKAGNLLINRRHLDLNVGVTSVDTGVKVSANNFSPDPQLPARLMILVMPPTPAWASVIAFSEPYLENGNLMVDFNCSASTNINVLFWLPHTLIGPVSADDYQATCAVIQRIGQACSVAIGGT